jgi:hypothetical protein
MSRGRILKHDSPRHLINGYADGNLLIIQANIESEEKADDGNYG